jgi:hypothetical protein
MFAKGEGASAMTWWLSRLSPGEIVTKVWRRVLPNLRYLPKSRIRRCGACQRLTVILAFSRDEELHLCLRCRANLRYELLATYLRQACPNVESLSVLELDNQSPLRAFLSRAQSYTRSYFRDGVARGEVRADGAVCEDITRLTFPDESLDLIVSSDVLEHVPAVLAAFRESARVLRPGGMHVFTVPIHAHTERTMQRARIEDGKVVHLITPPDYHYDPLSPEGILAFWEFGPDLPVAMATEWLEISAVAGPVGVGHRIIWQARKATDRS